MANTNRITWETIRTFDTSTVVSGSAYYPMGTPLVYPSYKLKMVNNSNVLLLISINGGTTAVDVCPPGSFWLYDETQANISPANSPAIPAGTQISVNSASGAGTGLVYLVSQYLINI